MKSDLLNRDSERCSLCGAIGEHFCVGKNSTIPKDYDKFVPFKDLQIEPVSISPKQRMTQDQVEEFALWLEENEPVLKKDKDYWELFAYRIVSKLGV